jgi:hypothetical protein
MKYTLHGFSQETALELGISNDELALLRWFIDFKDSGTMKNKYDVEKQKMFYWIVYTKIIEDLPLLTLGSETLEAKKKKLQRLINGNLSKVLEKKLERDKNGTYLYIALNESEYIKLISNKLSENEQQTETSKGVGQICPSGVGQNSPNKDSSIINYSSINDNKKKKKETEIDSLINSYTENEELRTNIYEFVKMRKGIKAAITTLGLKKLLNKLDKLAADDSDKIKILDNSIMNSWKGIFELKTNTNNNSWEEKRKAEYDSRCKKAAKEFLLESEDFNY